jgi:hypothetical protein
MTRASPSLSGVVSMTVRRSPLRRPTVVSSSAGIPNTFHPCLPPVTRRIPWWMVFMALKARS